MNGFSILETITFIQIDYQRNFSKKFIKLTILKTAMYRNSIQSNRLYEPLQQTLNKSMVRDPNLQLNKSRAYQMGITSRLSRRMKSLSPEEAYLIKSSTRIPVDKDLVPTSNLWKVRGKQFAAVDISVKQGQPIPASHIHIPAHLRNGGQVTTETVYELKPRTSNASLLANTRSITNLRTILPIRTIDMTNPSRVVSSSGNRVSTIVSPSRVSKIANPSRFALMANPTLVNPNTYSAVGNATQISMVNPSRVSAVLRPSTSSLDVRRTATPVRISNAPQIPLNEYQLEPVVVDQIRTSILNNDSLNAVNAPEDRKSLITNTGSYEQRGEVSDQQKKDKYRYNFFSALDEAVNTKCGSCGANEIIASKPLSSWQ